MPLPILNSQGDVALLERRLDVTRPVICLWATGEPRQTVDVLLHFRNLLRERGYQTLLLITRSGLRFFEKLCPLENRELVCQCDDISLLAECSLISLLFTHDYLISAPVRMAAKIVLFPHNFGTLPPFILNYWADYVISCSRDILSFDFATYPNAVKRGHNPYLTIIPAGYPKLDLLIALRKRYGPGPHLRVAYFPVGEFFLHSTGRYSEAVVAEEISFIDGFLSTYPGWEFVVHPYWNDRESRRFLDLRETFRHREGFCYDSGDDNIQNLVSADLLITDYSSIDRNFSYATLRPVVRLQVSLKGQSSSFRKTFLGYEAATAAQALAAVGDALADLAAWEQAITRERDREVLHPGSSLDYLCEHINGILNDRPASDWIILDKGDTPYDRVADYLHLCATPFPALAFRPTPVDWSIVSHGLNPKIGLAMLRACLHMWHGYSEVARLMVLQEQIETCITMIPPAQVLAFLRYRLGKEPESPVYRFWLAEVLTRFSPDSPDSPAMLDHLRGLAPDPVLAAGISRLLHRYGDAAGALAVLRRSLSGHQAPLPVYVLYVCLLLDAGEIEEAQAVLDGSLHFFVSAHGFSPHFLFCAALIRACRAGQPFPQLCSVQKPECLPLYGVHLAFQSAQHADAILSTFLEEMLSHARGSGNGQLWFDCSKILLACGREGKALSAARKAAAASPGMIFLLTHLTDMLSRIGRFEEAARVTEDAVRRWPSNAALLDTLSLLHECAGNTPAALDATRRALELDPQQPKRLLRLKELRGRLVRSAGRGR